MKQKRYLCGIINVINREIMKFSEFYKLLEEHGWRKDGGSRHEHYVHPDYDYFIPVGRHPSKEVPKGTLNKMLKDAGIKKQ